MKIVLSDPRLAGFLGLAGGSFALAVALAFQYGLGLPPCPLCIEQRWAHGAGIVSGSVALRFPKIGAGLAILGYGYGAGLALFHAGVEQKWWPGPLSCTSGGGTAKTLDDLRQLLATAPVILCDQIPWSFLGISMAGYNFLYSTALVLCLGAVLYRGLKSR